MSLTNTHPLYDATLEDQKIMRDTYAGERTVKNADLEYLHATPGMVADGMLAKQDGRIAYDGYKARAKFPDFVSDAVESLLGLLHQKPPTIELPAAMEPLRESATASGESMHNLLRRINEHQLVQGRLGLLLDMPENPDPANPLPWVALYTSLSMRNWDDSDDNVDRNKLVFVTLDESGFKRDANFMWTTDERYRVLALVDAKDGNHLITSGGTYMQGLYHGQGVSFDPTLMKPPMIRGKVLEEIPFVFVNSKDTLSRPDNPPLLGLARDSLSIYRSEADYRQALFMQGQDTLVVIGGTLATANGEPTRVGAGAKIDCEMNGDAKYIGVSSTGLPEMRVALENDRKAASARTGQLIDAMGTKQESGEALKTRLTAQTATLNQIALTGAGALQRILRIAAKWMGQNENDVIVIPNLEFASIDMSGKDLTELQTAKTMGAPIASESIHAIMQQRGLTKLTYEEELDRIADEKPLIDVPPEPDPDADPNANPAGDE